MHSSKLVWRELPRARAGDVGPMLPLQHAANCQARAFRLGTQLRHLSTVLHTQTLQGGRHTGPPNESPWFYHLLPPCHSGRGAKHVKWAQTPADICLQETCSTNTAAAYLALWHWGWGYCTRVCTLPCRRIASCQPYKSAQHQTLARLCQPQPPGCQTAHGSNTTSAHLAL